MIKILVVAHDAGGANILASLIKKYHNKFDWVICISGPARNIFLQKNIKSSATVVHLINNDIDSILKAQQPDFILTGTSWASELEVRFIKYAKKNKIKSASFLDHWGGYRERFGYPAKWKVNLPDLIFVGDKWAYRIALENGFPADMLFQVENPYFEEIIEEVNSIKQNKIRRRPGSKIKILYISQPIQEHAIKKYNDSHYWRYTEIDVLKNLLEVALTLKAKIPVELKVRLHPSERMSKYNSLLQNKNYQGIRKSITISSSLTNSLIKDCMWAGVIIGSGSMVLFIALLAGKKSISYIPDKKRESPLSQKEIRKAYSMPQKDINEIYSIDGLIRELNYFRNNQLTPSEGIKNYLFKDSFITVIN